MINRKRVNDLLGQVGLRIQDGSYCLTALSHFTWGDSIDVVLYGGLGLVLLGYAIYSVGRWLFDAGNHVGFITLCAVLLTSILSLARDLRRKHLSTPSKLLVGAWALCVGLVLVAELLEMAG